MFIDFLRIGHWQKTQGMYFWRRCQQQKKGKMIGGYRNCLVARTHNTIRAFLFPSWKNHHHLTGVASREDEEKQVCVGLEQQENGCCGSL
jgi:hypothetical protein